MQNLPNLKIRSVGSRLSMTMSPQPTEVTSNCYSSLSSFESISSFFFPNILRGLSETTVNLRTNTPTTQIILKGSISLKFHLR